jgi:hypothetical protein
VHEKEHGHARAAEQSSEIGRDGQVSRQSEPQEKSSQTYYCLSHP